MRGRTGLNNESVGWIEHSWPKEYSWFSAGLPNRHKNCCDNNCRSRPARMGALARARKMPTRSLCNPHLPQNERIIERRLFQAIISAGSASVSRRTQIRFHNEDIVIGP